MSGGLSCVVVVVVVVILVVVVVVVVVVLVVVVVVVVLVVVVVVVVFGSLELRYCCNQWTSKISWLYLFFVIIQLSLSLTGLKAACNKKSAVSFSSPCK